MTMEKFVKAQELGRKSESISLAISRVQDAKFTDDLTCREVQDLVEIPLEKLKESWLKILEEERKSTKKEFEAL